MEFPDRDLREAWLGLSEGQVRHLPPGALRAFLDGSRNPESEVHLASCGACRSALVALGRSRKGEAATPLSRWAGRARWVAAAALLVSAGVFWGVSRSGVPSPVSSLTGAAVRKEATGSERVLGASGKVCATPGASWSRAEDGAVLLERGALVLEAFGERAVLLLPGLVAETSEGVLAAEAGGEARTSAWTGFLAEALAESPTGRLTVVSGHAHVRAEGSTVDVDLGPGASVRAERGALLACAPVAWRGPDWSSPLRSEGLLRDAQEILLPQPPPEGCVLEVLVSKRSERAELGAILQAGGRGYLAVLGSNLLGLGEGWTLLRVSCGHGRVRVTVGEKDVLDLPEADLETRFPVEAAAGVGLKAWGGEIAFRRARWRPLP